MRSIPKTVEVGMKSGGEIEERGAHTNIMIYVGQRYPAEYYWEGKYKSTY